MAAFLYCSVLVFNMLSVVFLVSTLLISVAVKINYCKLK